MNANKFFEFFEAQQNVNEVFAGLKSQVAIEEIRQQIFKLADTSSTEEREFATDFFLYKVQKDVSFHEIAKALSKGELIEWYRTYINYDLMYDEEIQFFRYTQRQYNRNNKSSFKNEAASKTRPLHTLKVNVRTNDVAS